MLGVILSWVFAILSNICWLYVYISQIKENYINKSDFNLNFYFILCWFISDTLSNYSAYYKGSSIIIIYISSFNVIFDMIFICQYFYYKFYELFNFENCEPLLQNSNTNEIQIVFKNILKSIELQLLLVYIIFIIFMDLTISITHIEKNLIGQIYGWILCTLIVLARLPQLIFHYNKKSVKKSTVFIFIAIICANLFLLTSILIILIDNKDNKVKLEYITKNIQFIVTPIITTSLDFIIIYQYYYYIRKIVLDD